MKYGQIYSFDKWHGEIYRRSNAKSRAKLLTVIVCRKKDPSQLLNFSGGECLCLLCLFCRKFRASTARLLGQWLNVSANKFQEYLRFLRNCIFFAKP